MSQYNKEDDWLKGQEGIEETGKGLRHTDGKT